ncbi:MAG TPA: hypothetical protein VLU73_04490 [Methylococcaceae bacterium]|nr:hypothetical protein [Methylococcaceae bacterium]
MSVKTLYECVLMGEKRTARLEEQLLIGCGEFEKCFAPGGFGIVDTDLRRHFSDV